VPSLARWGLSPDADLVYRALVTARPRTSGWLARDLGMSPRRVAAATDELLAAGALRGPAGPLDDRFRRSEHRWRVTPPGDVIGSLRHRRRNTRLTEPGENVRRHLALVGGAVAGGVDANVRVARHVGTKAVRARIAELVMAQRHEHLVLNPEHTFARSAAAASVPLDRLQVERGVRVRNCGVPPLDGDLGFGPLTALARTEGEYRERAEVPIKLMIYDRRVALLPADPLDFAAGAIELDQSAAVAAMVVLFEEVWSTASDPRRNGMPSIVLTAREQTIVGLLAQGHTDGVVAQRIGISQRTIAYTMRALMDRLGVENRFQLGLILGAARATEPFVEPDPQTTQHGE
jgi:DNA-binding CsgD family transcriptional regulator